MTDFHSHILPGIDDGSKDCEESLALLRMLSEQGIDTVVATPHFLADNESPEDFVQRRQGALDQLTPLLSAELPEIVLGAEAAYYEGISALDGLSRLCIGNTRLLLVEMPMCKWSESALKELQTLSCVKGFTVILAHIERYFRFQSPSVFARLRNMGILMQVNASFFNRAMTKRKALSMLFRGEINVIGSDCHNLTLRPPTIGQAYELIKLKSERNFITDLTEYHKALLSGEI